MPLTVQLLSDLHLEFHRDKGRGFIKSLDPSGVDVLVLAGDIDLEKGLRDTMTHLCSLYPRVIYVAGNHEYYGSSPDQVHETLTSLDAKLVNFTWLRNHMARVEGVLFAGATLWFPRPRPEVALVKGNMNDFHLIKGFEPWVYDEHAEAEAFLNAAASQAQVVVTHHIPSYEGVSPRFRGSMLNHYFCHDLTPLIKAAQPSYWLFGHTHDCLKFTIGETRLMANPFGYPHEQGSPSRGTYQEKLVLSIG